ncbi:nucleoside recognition family protein [Marinomonas arenicola]|uniref:Nucleoside recognition family protein n=1 Tax=Marinomonas arenicola TaxID=569601 RepID=A0ABU9G0J6_9GAMM
MDQFISLVLVSGKAGLDMALYILLPMMVIMLAIMKLLDAKGVLSWLCDKIAPVTRLFGIPGLGVFAALKITFVSFAAPIATLSLMDKNGTNERHLAATIAMVLAMSQANAAFPLAAVGLNVGILIATSFVGGLAAAAVTYYLFTKSWDSREVTDEDNTAPAHYEGKKSVLQILSDGGQEGMRLALGMIPMLIIAIFFVNLLKTLHVIDYLAPLLAPALSLINLPEASVLPLITKFIAGGTAYVGITIDLVKQGAISVTELNRMAGFATNPLDIAGIAIFAAAGTRINKVMRVAIYGGLIGMLLRGVLHLIIF